MVVFAAMSVECIYKPKAVENGKLFWEDLSFLVHPFNLKLPSFLMRYKVFNSHFSWFLDFLKVEFC